MKIVTTTSVFPPSTEMETIIPRLVGVGFDTLDLAFDYCDTPDHPFMGSDYEGWAESVRDLAAKHGVTFTHAHAPFDSDRRTDLAERTMRCCEIIGIPYLVVHPAWKKAEEVYYEGEEFIEVNRKAILPILDIAERHGVTVLSENLLWGASIQPSAISDLVRAVNRPNFGWCYDSGHAHCFGITPRALVGLEVPLSLHLQDNHGVPMGDEHLIPGDGTINWEDLMQTLREIGYAGELVLEAHSEASTAPDEDRDVILKRLFKSAEHLLTI